MTTPPAMPDIPPIPTPPDGEIMVRFDKIRTWAQQVVDGRCSPRYGADGILGLLGAMGFKPKPTPPKVKRRRPRQAGGRAA